MENSFQVYKLQGASLISFDYPSSLELVVQKRREN
jgi:hypothetical protein